MDATVCPTEADLLRALIPLVPPATIQATLDELGLSSVPRNRLLEDALVSIIEAVPVLQTRLFGQVRLTVDQAAAMLHTTPSTLRLSMQTEVSPVCSLDKAPPMPRVIVAAELLNQQSYIRRRLAA